jgi:hypothetical protein
VADLVDIFGDRITRLLQVYGAVIESFNGCSGVFKGDIAQKSKDIESFLYTFSNDRPVFVSEYVCRQIAEKVGTDCIQSLKDVNPENGSGKDGFVNENSYIIANLFKNPTN